MARTYCCRGLPERVPRLGHHPRVVHQAVQRVDAAGQVVGPIPHGVEIPDVAYLVDHHRPGNPAADDPSRVPDLLGLRPSTCTVAPSSAKDCAMASPRPEVAPVTTTRLPAMAFDGGSAGHHRRPDLGVAENDGPVQGSVEDTGDRHDLERT